MWGVKTEKSQFYNHKEVLVACWFYSYAMIVYMWIDNIYIGKGSRGGRVVKLLDCGGPGFEARSRHLNFRD